MGNDSIKCGDRGFKLTLKIKFVLQSSLSEMHFIQIMDPRLLFETFILSC